MAQQNTFDVVSKVDMAEVKNAVNQAMKEITQRYDFKGTNSSIDLDEKEHKMVLATASEFTLRNSRLIARVLRPRRKMAPCEYGDVLVNARVSSASTVSRLKG